jgi:hypothetical protein
MRTYGENNRQTHHISARAMKQIITDRFIGICRGCIKKLRIWEKTMKLLLIPLAKPMPKETGAIPVLNW